MVMYTDFTEYAPECTPGAPMEEKSKEGRVIDGVEGYRWRQRHQRLWIPLVRLVVGGVP